MDCVNETSPHAASLSPSPSSSQLEEEDGTVFKISEIYYALSRRGEGRSGSGRRRRAIHAISFSRNQKLDSACTGKRKKKSLPLLLLSLRLDVKGRHIIFARRKTSPPPTPPLSPDILSLSL